jgi:Fic family protein
MPNPWSAHGSQTRPWQPSVRGGTRADRMLPEVTVRLPPMIADLTPDLDTALVAELERAMRRVATLDADAAADLEALGTLLLRTESVASSKIEHVEASLDDYALALHGIRSNPSAVSMVAATTALRTMINEVAPGTPLHLDTITAAHEVLMRDDAHEARYAGGVRDVQNWIGGSDHSPRGALYVPPPHESVPDYLDDLITFANRDDLPALVQAAIVHAQFESIHPFTDGNGRIGRALINTVLRRRGATTRTVVPLASALVAQRDKYFDLLNAYRDGAIRPLLLTFAAACEIAAAEAMVTAERLRTIPSEWAAQLGPVRRDSAAGRILELLPTRPVLSPEDVGSELKSSRSAVFAAVSRLAEAGVLRPLTDRKRDQVWGATAVLDEIQDLGLRIETAGRHGQPRAV